MPVIPTPCCRAVSDEPRVLAPADVDVAMGQVDVTDVVLVPRPDDAVWPPDSSNCVDDVREEFCEFVDLFDCTGSPPPQGPRTSERARHAKGQRLLANPARVRGTVPTRLVTVRLGPAVANPLANSGGPDSVPPREERMEWVVRL